MDPQHVLCEADVVVSVRGHSHGPAAASTADARQQWVRESDPETGGLHPLQLSRRLADEGGSGGACACGLPGG